VALPLVLSCPLCDEPQSLNGRYLDHLLDELAGAKFGVPLLARTQGKEDVLARYKTTAAAVGHQQSKLSVGRALTVFLANRFQLFIGEIKQRFVHRFPWVSCRSFCGFHCSIAVEGSGSVPPGQNADGHLDRTRREA